MSNKIVGFSMRAVKDERFRQLSFIIDDWADKLNSLFATDLGDVQSKGFWRTIGLAPFPVLSHSFRYPENSFFAAEWRDFYFLRTSAFIVDFKTSGVDGRGLYFVPYFFVC